MRIRYVNYPHPSDVFYASAWSLTIDKLLGKLLPWIRKNPFFTRMAIYRVLNVLPNAQHQTWGRLSAALDALRCVRIAQTASGDAIFGPKPGDRDLAQTSLVTSEGLVDVPGEPPPSDQVELARAWVRDRCVPTSSYNQRKNSYALKHDAEYWSERQPDTRTSLQTNQHTGETYTSNRFYVSNGALILAMMLEGYGPKRVGRSVNARFKVSVKSNETRGRKPGATPVEYVEVEAVQVSGLEAVNERKKLRRFLDRRKSYDNPAQLQFSIREAANGSGTKMNFRNPPDRLLENLRLEGCVRTRERRTVVTSTGKSKKVWRVLWARFVDMPALWQHAHRKLAQSVVPAPHSEPEFSSTCVAGGVIHGTC